MKNWLLTLSSISALTLSSITNSFILTNNKNINNTIGNNNKSKFNNSFNALGDGSTVRDKEGKIISNFFITNQSTSDQKYYSYDLSHANYQLPDSHKYAYTFFIVDSKGLLQYTNEQKQLPTDDQSYLANTKTQMESNKKITTIKDSYNPYSNSIYDSNYFIGQDENWQFLQMGGIENHIDLSSQINGDKVEHYQDLSESLGLYYIAKAVIQQKIDEAVADNLANYFISKSSLKDKMNEGLTKQIIKVIVHNDNIYNFIYNTPFNNNDEKYSLNLIFDNKDNLIETYYNEWDRNHLKPIDVGNKLDAKSDISGAGIVKTHTSSSDEFFLSWKDLKVNNYNQFLSAFSKVNINFNDFSISYISREGDSTYFTPGFNSNINLNILFTNNWYSTTLATYWTSNYFGHCAGTLYLYTKCTDKGIVFQSTSSVTGGGSSYGDHIYGNISVNSIIFD